MAKPGRKSEKEQINTWLGKIGQGDAAYKKWANKYQIDRFENFYHGIQWNVMGETSDANIEKYVINLYFSAIETKKPSLLFYHPKYSVSARPTREEDSQSNADGRARLRQDVLNTFVPDPKLHFRDKTSICLLESLFTFTVIEVGYTADFVDNPQAGRPIIEEGVDTGAKQPERLPSNERLFLKRIPSKTFRVPQNAKNQLEENDWCGYYEYHYPQDLKANPNYSNTSTIHATASVAQDSVPGDFGGKVGADTKDEETEKHRDMVKVWKIWDNRQKERFVFVEGGSGFLLRKKFKFLPFADLKFIERLDEYYPFPLTYNWIWPQQEVNDIAEAERIHRQRFKRKYQARDGTVTPEELAKFANGDDGTIVFTAADQAIHPIEDAPLDSAVRISRADSKSDFNEVSSVTNEMRGVSETQTATQSNILDTRARIRESLERVEVGSWLAAVGRLILMTVEEYMAMPFWVRTVVDPLSGQAPALARSVEATWREITSEDLGDIDYDVSVDIDSLSPSTEMQTQQAWNQFLQQVMSNPLLLQLMALSPTILQRTATLNGIKNAKDLEALEQAIPQLVQAMAQAAMAAQQAKAGGASGAAQPGPTPGLQDIQAQLQAQMPQPGIPQ